MFHFKYVMTYIERHIGNDVVVCVFQGNNTFLNKLLIYCKEGNAVFKPSILSSRQIRMFTLQIKN